MEKAKMYQNREEKEFHNNMEMYTSYKNNNISDNINIRKKIYDIINSKSFIYVTKVNIVIGNEVVTKKIIGVSDNNLVTIDNEYIPIEYISDIYK